MGDLTLKKGDIIYIVDNEDAQGWWTGIIGNREGLFPSTYVKMLDSKKIPTKTKSEPDEGDILIARFNYDEGGQEELKFICVKNLHLILLQTLIIIQQKYQTTKYIKIPMKQKIKIKIKR